MHGDEKLHIEFKGKFLVSLITIYFDRAWAAEDMTKGLIFKTINLDVDAAKYDFMFENFLRAIEDVVLKDIAFQSVFLLVQNGGRSEAWWREPKEPYWYQATDMPGFDHITKKTTPWIEVNEEMSNMLVIAGKKHFGNTYEKEKKRKNDPLHDLPESSAIPSL